MAMAVCVKLIEGQKQIALPWLNILYNNLLNHMMAFKDLWLEYDQNISKHFISIFVFFLYWSEAKSSNNNSSSFQASRICVNVEEKRKHHLSGEPNSWQCKLNWKWWDKTLQFYTNQPVKACKKVYTFEIH